MSSLTPIHLRCRLFSFWSMVALGLLDLAGVVFLVCIAFYYRMPFVALPVLLLLFFAAWMFFQAWGYWTLTVEIGEEGLHIRVPRERFGIFSPPAQDLACPWREVEEISTSGQNRQRVPGTGMLLRMPTDFLIIRTAKRGTILLNYAMVKSQIHEIAALLKEKSGKSETAVPRRLRS